MGVPGNANALLLASAAVSGGYQVSRSLRFNGSIDTSYLNRTPASAGNRKTWTWSGWVKRSGLGSFQKIFGNEDSSELNGVAIQFRSDNSLHVYDITSSVQWQKITTAVYRDPSSWYHLVVAVDTTNGTAGDRVKIYINGVRETSFSTSSDPSSSADTQLNTTTAHGIGRSGAYNGSYFNGYLADIYFIDGQALTPSSFAETDATTGQWIPKAYSGSYGSNGWKLSFSDNSTTAALGTDTSSNGNTWTTNNFSITAGSGNDSLTDTPTSYGTDTGVGGEVRGNYATLNPLDKGSDVNTVTNGNLEATWSGVNGHSIRATIAVSSGKWYWEATGFNALSAGIIAISQPIVPSSGTLFPGGSGFGAGNSYGYYAFNGSKATNGTVTSYGASYGTSDVVGIALDLDNGTLTFYKNGTTQGTAFTGISGTFAPAFGYQNAGTNNLVVNFGQRAFAYPVSGFKALVDTNLPVPTISKGNTVMDVALWSGNGGSQTITLPGAFSPDFVWIKRRSSTFSSLLYDTIRGNGPNTGLISDSTTAEGGASDNSTYGYLNAFNSTGFALTAGSSSGYVNTSGQTYVGWAWDAGTSTVTNTAGSITSQVRANASAGFSVVTYVSNGTNNTSVGHGLNVKPALVIQKDRTSASDWLVLTQLIDGSNDYLLLNSTAAAGNAAAGMTSTIFGSWDRTNGNNMVAYCFAPVSGYSAMSSYVSTGTSDNAFQYCGFRPRFILLKNASVSNSWVILDAARSTYNAADDWLGPNSSSAEDSNNAAYSVDFLSNGFKVRSGNGIVGNSGDTVIWAAFAESPFQYARAR